jgi:hypothetical protein
MKVNHVWARFLKGTEEAPRGIRQMLTQVSLYSETIRSHLFAERAKGRYCVYAWVVTLLPLEAAHLRDKRLSPSDFHAVNHMRNSHSGCLRLRQHGADKASNSYVDCSQRLTA